MLHVLLPKPHGASVAGYFSIVFLLLSVCILSACQSPTQDDLSSVTGVSSTTNTETTKTVAVAPLNNSALSFTPSTYNFGSLIANIDSATKSFTVTNTSGFDVTILFTYGTNAYFTITSTTCTDGASLPVNGTCTFTAKFAPTLSGTLSTAISIFYYQSSAANYFSSNVSLLGQGTTLTGFSGLDSISDVTTNSVKLNWTAAVGGDTYQVYQIATNGTPTLVTNASTASACIAGNCAYSVTGLIAHTTYTYRVRATDSFGVQEQNILNRSATTLTGYVTVTGAATIMAGQCAPITVSLKDGNGVAQPVSANTAITMSGLGAASIYSNGTCTTSISGPTITTGNSSATFYMKDNTAEALTVTGALTSYTSNSLSTTVAAVLFDLSTGTASDSVGNCHAVTVTAKDTSNAAMNIDASATVAIGGKGSGALFSDSSCATSIANPTITAGTSAVTFYVRDTVAESLTLTSSYSAYASTGDAQAISFTPLGADHLVYVEGNNQSAAPQAALTIQPKVRVVDRYENAVSGVDLAFLTERGGGFCTTNSYVTSDASGYASVSFKNGPYDLKNTVRVTRVGGVLPDVAGSGNATYKFTETVSAASNSGVFQQHLIPGINPAEIVHADFNGDGRQDLAVGNVTSSTISVYLAQSNGSFTTSTTYTSGSSPFGIATGDLNADGKPDIVVSNYGSNTVSVFLNKGDGTGTFYAKADYAVGATPYGRAAIYDLTGDGKPDLAVPNYTSNTISVLSNTGTGTFNTQVTYATGTGPRNVAAGDFNGDGKPDVAVTNYGTYATTGSISVFYGTGTAGSYTLTAKADTNLGGYVHHIMTGDLNNDGRPDLVVTKYVSNLIAVLLGQGTAGSYTFAAPVNYVGTGSPFEGELYDINGDGFLDLVAPDYATGDTVTAYFNDGSGGFNSRTSYAIETGTSNPTAVAVFDADGDGKPDIFYTMYTLSYIGMLKGVGTGLFRTNKTILGASGGYLNFAHPADLNGDGKMDLVTNYYGGVVSNASVSGSVVEIFLGNGDGTFQAKTSATTGSGPADFTYGDFNQDGKLDIAVANYYNYSSSTYINSVSVLLGNGNGSFQPKIDTALGTSVWTLAAADFNKDGKLDLVVANYPAGTIQVLFGDGTGHFGTPTTYATSGTGAYALAVGDIDGDGDLDIVDAVYSGAALNVFKNNGVGGFGAYTSYTMGTNPYSVRLADVNGDGALDMVTAVYGANLVSVHLNKNDGSGTFFPKSDYTGITAPIDVSVSDVDGDGKLDLVVASYSANYFGIYKGTGTGAFSTPPVLYTMDKTTSQAMSIDIADLDGDGKMDIIVPGRISPYGLTDSKVHVFFGW